MLVQVGFKTFLNVTPTISFPQAVQAGPVTMEFILTLEDNPLSEFAELPKDAIGEKISAQGKPLRTKWAVGEVGGQEEGLWFSNILCGVIRGCLEMV
jgi:hypothetical protein